MGFQTFSALDAAYAAGKSRIYSWRKVPTQTTALGIWFDLSMSPGNPIPNYYAATPLVAKRLAQSTDGGLFHGDNVWPETKHIHRFTAITTAVPLPLIVLDYLLYYPFIDMSTTDPQTMIQTETLGRYTDGAGVKIMAVEVASQIGGVSFNVEYTNQSGVSGRVTPNVTCNTQVSVGTIITTAPATAGCSGPFLPLQAGDTGVRSIQRVTFLSADVGLITLVLVKPLAMLGVHDLTAPTEKDFAHHTPGQLPRIVDDAYLNMICLPMLSLASAQILGTLETVYS